jgi:hypothetical protein
MKRLVETTWRAAIGGLVVAALAGGGAMVAAAAGADAGPDAKLVPGSAAPLVGRSFAQPLGPLPPELIVPPKADWLPPAQVREEPRLLKSAQQSAVPMRPAADLPPLAPSSVAGADERPVMVVGPRIQVASPDPAKAPPLPQRNIPTLDQVLRPGDPTLEQSSAAATATVLEFRKLPAPLLRLTLPDPFEAPALLKLLNPPADSEPPVSATAVPAKPVLPVPAKP